MKLRKTYIKKNQMNYRTQLFWKTASFFRKTKLKIQLWIHLSR